MNDRIAHALTRLFDRHRIVFWYDSNRELRDEFDALDLPEVEKLEIHNNEYGIKHRILRKESEQKFLLYRAGPEPDNLENWLLDVQLAEGIFRTDQLSIWLAELELGIEFAEVIEPHKELLLAAKRRKLLKELLSHEDTPELIRMKMLAVCVDSNIEPHLDKIMEILLQELSQDKDEKVRLIKRCALDDFLWKQLNRKFGYKSDEPGIQDFAIELFKSCYAMGIQTQSKLTNDALSFLKNWKDNRNFQDGFEILSGKSANILGIQQDLENRDFRELMKFDYFKLIDQKIISEAIKNLVSHTASHDDVLPWIRQRRQSHWYKEFRDLYEAINFAAQFTDILHKTNLTINSVAEGIRQYTQSWYRLDQLYRKFVYHAHKSRNASLTEGLMNQIENLYTNSFLLKVGDQFQSFVEKAENWGDDESMVRQNQFFGHWVQPFLFKNNKVCVIISDAMRYEIGDELLKLIRQKDRYSAELQPALSMLPSYTQLGMAALLPNDELSIVDNDSGTVLVNGKSSTGTVNRNKILQKAVGKRSRAIKYEDFMQFNRDDSRELLKDNDVVYIYHNRIDHAGDKLHSEGLAFEAAQLALSDIDNLINKLTGANASNILVTADHGFIYQHRVLDESDFLGVSASGKEIFYRDRRFVLGRELARSNSFHHFTSEQLGLVGEIEVQIPKSINRLRLKGSGSRFVHGGASLQEVVIPVLKVNKKRQSDVRKVDVEILRGASSVITSGQLSVTMYQTEPITDKVQQRELRAGIYAESGNLISDLHVVSFDLASDHPRDRELPIRFVLTKEADEANDQEVVLRLEEKHAGTSHYKEYRSIRYTMRRSFTTDFDF
ncbi:MAG: BREX-1 system phosphatase PglZ type A [Gammaproteobacteria bacterium]|nr:BREX-1 system phosphatase PglZ type A [Gammaproteobacteria bacterium]